MVKVSIHKNEIGQYIGACLVGHAEYDELGQDIVCAAVSVLILNTINSIETFTSDNYVCDIAEEGGFVDFKLTSEPSSEALLLIKSLVLGITGLSKDYGEEFVQID